GARLATALFDGIRGAGLQVFFVFLAVDLQAFGNWSGNWFGGGICNWFGMAAWAVTGWASVVWSNEVGIATVFLNTANVLYLICYMVKDVLMLRILAVVAMLALIPYYYLCGTTPMYGPIAWNVVFMAVNIVWIVLILIERRPPRLSEDERKLYEMVFRNACSERDMLRLLREGRWCEAEPRQLLVTQGTTPEQLILIHSGRARVLVDGREVASLRSGDLVGEMSYLTKGQTVADVAADGPVRYVVWQRKTLETLFMRRDQLRTALYHLIGHDLVDKLMSSQVKVPELSTQIRVEDIGEK
ncbi:MAG: cyclic nucleotide-binding domain-containing protein, partial [Planctomycetales bacterium]|nr:cyclic nucleotide-binding domain-containing protein [Planctomycetales bacterium]